MDKLSTAGFTELQDSTGYTSFDRTGGYFLTSSYHDGHFDVYQVKPDGVLGDRVSHQQAAEKYAHSVLTTPDNKFLYVPCVKEFNAIYQYCFRSRNRVTVSRLILSTQSRPTCSGHVILPTIHPCRTCTSVMNSNLGQVRTALKKTASLQLSSMLQRFLVDHPTPQVYEACMQVILLSRTMDNFFFLH
jgi:hypothetical protein